MNKILRVKIVEHFSTQEKFAVISGINESIISKLIREIRKPTEQQKTILSKLLKTDKTILFN